jgi:hypothetical protein
MALKTPDVPFFWEWRLDSYQLPDLALKYEEKFKALGQDCTAERVIGNSTMQMVEEAKKKLGKRWLSVKLRRGDDVSRTAACTEPQLIAKAVRIITDNLIGDERGEITIFIMMEPEPGYRNTLQNAILSHLNEDYIKQGLFKIMFEEDIMDGMGPNSNNYLSYIGSYEIEESSPLGRLEGRRIEDGSPMYKFGKCSLRWFPTAPYIEVMRGRIFRSGNAAEYHQFFPKAPTDLCNHTWI